MLGVVVTFALLVAIALFVVGQSTEDDRGTGAILVFPAFRPTDVPAPLAPPPSEPAPVTGVTDPLPTRQVRDRPAAPSSSSATGSSTRPRPAPSTAAPRPPARVVVPPVGSRVILERAARPGTVIRHRNFRLRTDRIGPSSSALARQDATFVVRRGLARTECISFESVNYPGRYVRHRNFVLRLDTRARTALFESDATFCVEPAAERGELVLRSVNYPDRVIVTDRDGSLILTSPPDDEAATFRFRPGLS